MATPNPFIKAIYQEIKDVVSVDAGERSRVFTYPNFPVDFSESNLKPFIYVGTQTTNRDSDTKNSQHRKLSFPIQVFSIASGETGTVDGIAESIRAILHAPEKKASPEPRLTVEGWTVYIQTVEGPADYLLDDLLYCRLLTLNLSATPTT